MKLQDLLDFAHGASNAAASTVGGPMDLAESVINLLRAGYGYGGHKAGLLSAEEMPQLLSGSPGTTEWMRQRGLVQEPQNKSVGLLGEVAGAVAPTVVAAKAPQISAGIERLIQNATKPTSLNRQLGAIVFHGTPSRITKFDSSKIGTGEGAQSYGHGLYFAESKDVADKYAGKLSQPIVEFASKKPTTGAEKRLAAEIEKRVSRMAYGARGEEASNVYTRNLHPSSDRLYGNAFAGLKPLPPRELAEALATQRAAQRLGAPSVYDAGHLYKVEIPDPIIKRMIDWDAGGQQIWQSALEKYGTPQAAADALRQQGITGIRYLDQGSRASGGTRNMVLFPGQDDAANIIGEL